MNMTKKRKAGKIHLPRAILRFLSSHTVCVVVTVLNIPQLAMFQDPSKGLVLSGASLGLGVGAVPSTWGHHPVSVAGQTGGWSSSGCVTQPRDKGTVSSCDHLTFFTLLLMTTPLPTNSALDGSTAQAMMAIATAGCRVAMAFFIFIITFCIFFRALLSGDHAFPAPPGDAQVQVHVRGDPLHQPILPGQQRDLQWDPAGDLQDPGGGSPTTACSFTWMVLEGCHLYLLFIKVLGTYIHHYLVKLVSLFLPGFPALVVGVAEATSSYEEYTEPLEASWFSLFRCWITSKHLLVHYITNCGYFGLNFLFNTAGFGVVVQKSCCLQGKGVVQGDSKAWKVALVVMGLFCLLGATWALVFLTHGTSSVPMLYLFTILNSLQGIFIFTWLVFLYYPKAKETLGSFSHTIRHDKDTTASQD
uniref:Uncharacterized protein n=1 Tax=Melopsittacus undulatus TaxID=13146 RepID=A0A8C6IQ78_MELUD